MTVFAILVVLTIAAVATWLGSIICEARRDIHDLARPVSRRALAQLSESGEDHATGNATRGVSQ